MEEFKKAIWFKKEEDFITLLQNETNLDIIGVDTDKGIPYFLTDGGYIHTEDVENFFIKKYNVENCMIIADDGDQPFYGVVVLLW